MYVKHCKLGRKKQLALMKYFVAGSMARTAADLVGIHRNTAVRFFHKLREKIALKQQNRSKQFCGKIELDESYFGGTRKGKRGRGAAGKVAVFGLFKRGGKVYTQIIGADIMHWTSLNSNISESITVLFLLKNIITLTVLKTSGIRQNDT